MSCQSALYISFFLRLLLLRLHRRERPYYYYYYFLFFFSPSSVKISISSGWNGTHIAAAAAEEITKKKLEKGGKEEAVGSAEAANTSPVFPISRTDHAHHFKWNRKKIRIFFYRNKRSTSRGVNSFFCVFPLVREIRMLFKTQTNCTRHGISEMTFKVHWSNQNERKMGGGKKNRALQSFNRWLAFLFFLFFFSSGVIIAHQSMHVEKGKPVDKGALDPYI